MYYRHMERRNYNGDEFEGKDCGLSFDGSAGAVDNTLCGEFEKYCCKGQAYTLLF